jgi:hypothetical protein
MTKYISLLVWATMLLPQTATGQITRLYYDRKFKTVQNYYYATYYANVDTANPVVAKVIRIDNPDMPYAVGVVYPDNDLRFEGKVTFPRRGKSDLVRYYKNGKMLPFLCTNTALGKETCEKTNSYMAISETGEFYAYEKIVGQDFISDRLYAQGRVTDTTSMRLDGIIKYFRSDELVDCQKFDKGVLMPFIESTIDIQEPYERIKIISRASNVRDMNEIDNEHRKFIAQCIAAGADGVVGVRTSFSTRSWDTGVYGYDILIQGTIIRLKK